MPRTRFLFLALSVLTLWRLALLPTQELSPDEAFIALKASQGWSFDYTLHGPLMTWLARLGMRLGGHEAFGVRFWAPWLGLISSLCFWRLARSVFDRSIAGWALVILNLLPAFNLASIHWTPATVLWATLPAAALLLHRAIGRSSGAWKSWTGVGLLLGLGILATPAGLVGLPALIVALGLPRRRRKHLRRPGCLTACGIALIPALLWIQWELTRQWPRLQDGLWEPDRYLLPGWFRWLVLMSPVVFTALVVALRPALWRVTDRATHSMLLGFALPIALCDLFWGPMQGWPDTGLSAWMGFGAILVAHLAVTSPLPHVADRISWRTIGLGIAALQSVFLMNTDFVRTLGVHWSFGAQMTEAHKESPYLRLFTRDPSSVSRGWTRTAQLLRDVLTDQEMKEDRGGRPFLIASDWQMAACLNATLPVRSPCLWPSPAHPRVYPLLDPMAETSPFAQLPRYDFWQGDGPSPFTGADALYISDDPRRNQPPSEIRRSFRASSLLTVAQVIHGGQEVREVRIFACYGYRPPEF